jgi:hypothetical protein
MVNHSPAVGMRKDVTDIKANATVIAVLYDTESADCHVFSSRQALQYGSEIWAK